VWFVGSTGPLVTEWKRLRTLLVARTGWKLMPGWLGGLGPGPFMCFNAFMPDIRPEGDEFESP
jgi:hypothetical protein